MKTVPFLIALCVLTSSIESALAAEPDQQTSQVSHTETVTLTSDDYRNALLRLPASDRKKMIGKPTEALKFALALHSNEALATLAERNGVSDSPIIQARLEEARRNVLMTAWMEHLLEQMEKPDLSQLARERFLADRESYRIPERRKVAHIMLTDQKLCPCEVKPAEDQINELYGQLNLGANFADLAKEHSHDLATRDTGGQIAQWVELKDIGSKFEAQVFQLKNIGDLSQPFRGRQGWHIVKLVEIQPSRIPKYEEVADRVQKRVWNEMKSTKLERARGEQYPTPDQINVKAIDAILVELNEADNNE